MSRESQQALLQDAADKREKLRDIEREIETRKYVEKNRRQKEEYERRKAEKKAGLRPGIREKSDGIFCVM